MTVLNYTDSCWLNPEHVLHFQKQYFKYHILWDEYIKTFIIKYVGQSLWLWWDMRFGSWEFNYHWIWTTTTCLDSSSPFSCSFQLSILCLLITALHALNPSRPPCFFILSPSHHQFILLKYIPAHTLSNHSFPLVSLSYIRQYKLY